MKHTKGFTLLEILIAIAIMAVVLAALYSTFFLANKAMFSADKSLVKLQESRAFIDILKREIESVLYLKDKSYYIFKIDDRDFYGRQISSLTITSSSPLMNGLVKINYAVEERAGILVITKSMVSAFSQAPESNRVDLIEDIESFDIQAKYQNQWVKTWDSALTKSVPEEVKITLNMRIKNKEGETVSAIPFSMADMAKLKVGSTI
ncbi:MAG: prepilin-type N-terminal cleavage/methylation domain-containing protein [Syntrophaceae bacterium]